MTMQINVRVTEEFMEDAQRYAAEHGYLNVQEFLRDAAREKLYPVRPEYGEKLANARTLSGPEARAFEKKLRRRDR